MDELQGRIELILAIVALLGAVFGWIKVVRPRVRKGMARGTAALDTIAGRPAVVDSITGKELAPELPSIGKRMESVEGSMARLVEVVEGQHNQDRRLDDHEHRLKQLEEQVIERVANKAESVATWRAVEAIARGTDPTTPELEE